MSKMNIELFGYDTELISYDREDGSGLTYEFATELNGYISLGGVTARIKGRSCAIDLRRMGDGEYTPHLILEDRTLDLPRVRIRYGVVTPIEPDSSCLTKLSIRERRLCERVDSLEKKLNELTKKITGSSLFSAAP